MSHKVFIAILSKVKPHHFRKVLIINGLIKNHKMTKSHIRTDILSKTLKILRGLFSKFVIHKVYLYLSQTRCLSKSAYYFITK
jgi:hypothetical protein